MRVGKCPQCGDPISLTESEVEMFKQGLGDILVVRCPSCGKPDLVVKNPFKRSIWQQLCDWFRGPKD